MVQTNVALLERETGPSHEARFEAPPQMPPEIDAHFRLRILSVGDFTVRAASEDMAWDLLTQHGEEHPSMKIGRPLEMLPGFAVAERVYDALLGRSADFTYIRAVRFFEPSHVVIPESPGQRVTKPKQNTLPLIFPRRKFKPGE